MYNPKKVKYEKQIAEICLNCQRKECKTAGNCADYKKAYHKIMKEARDET